MSNAAKHRKKAAEFEQLKQIDRAIASYIRAIEESESEGEDVDVVLLNKVGDLTMRQGRVPDAVTYYERAVEHYAASGLFNNAIALCNKILRSAPGRSNVYFTLGRICAKKGLRGDATRNFLEYATRMQHEGRVDEGMRALAEVADLMPELTEIRRLVEEHAERVGIELPRRKTPAFTPAMENERAVFRRDDKSKDLVFLDVGVSTPSTRNTPPLAPRIQTPPRSAKVSTPWGADSRVSDDRRKGGDERDLPPRSPTDRRQIGYSRGNSSQVGPASLDAFLLFDPTRPGAVTPTEQLNSVMPAVEPTTVPMLELVGDAVVAPVVEERGTLVTEQPSETVLQLEEPQFEQPVAEERQAAIDGFESNVAEVPTNQEALDGIEFDTGSLLVPDESGEPPEEVADLETTSLGVIADLNVDVLSGLVLEDFDHVADDPRAVAVTGGRAGTPPYTQTIPRSITPIEVSPIPELDAAIEAGALTAARAEGDAEILERRPPFRLDPHDFILPGELPPMRLEDSLIDAGQSVDRNGIEEPREGFALSPFDDDAMIDESAPLVTPSYVPEIEEPAESLAEPAPVDDDADADADADAAAAADAAADANADADAETVLRETIEAHRAISTTPSLPLAAVAAEANVVASSRREDLRAAVTQTPHDWMLRRRLAEALFEVGERDGGLAELQAALTGFVHTGDLTSAADVSDELVRLSPERIQYHQKRVELAVRLDDQQRVRAAYLDLADTLVRSGDDTRAHAVYARVLEIDPWNERARAALGPAAPPQPPTQPSPDDAFVSLADWLRDDEPGTTRMRMREPVVSGDEQADFDALLRHFKEGVARSLGEDDYESHYDLGVAYKEMGLLDDAIAEFQKALRSRRHRLPAYEALGQCFVEQTRHSVAATVLTRALHEPGLGDEQRVGVLYLLAYSCEALQRWDEARSYYSRVYATDIHFRDVAVRLAALDLVAR